MSTCNWLILETLGSRLIMLKISLDIGPYYMWLAKVVKVTYPIIEDYVLSNFCNLCTLAFGKIFFSYRGTKKYIYISHDFLKFNLSFSIRYKNLNYFARVCYNRFQKVSF